MASGFQSAGDDPDFEDDNDDFTLGPTPKPTPPPAKQYTNGLFKPLTKRQEDMLNQEYYNKKNMVGRDKLYFSLRRQYGPDAPTQKAINDWLQQQNVHQVHRRLC